MLAGLARRYGVLGCMHFVSWTGCLPVLYFQNVLHRTEGG
jgi:hypothetical protein